VKLRDLEVGQSARIIGFEPGSDPVYRQKLLRMGLVKGSRFELIRKAPLGDPVEIELAGFKLTLRKFEADVVRIEVD
jgi:ferrous iron transport protein A